MAFGGKRLLTVDWDTQDLRMALVQPRGTGIELLKAVSVPVPKDVASDDPERFGAFLREAIRQSRIGNKHAVFCVPREQVVLNTINLPPSPADDLPAIVLNQIARELPFSSDQAVIDFALSTDHDPKDPATALVAAVRVDDIDFYRKVATEAGLSLTRIGLRPYANRLAVMACVNEAADQTVLVVESGPHHTEIDVLRGGALVFSRSATATMPVLREERVDRAQDSRITTPGVLDARESEHTREAISRLMVEIIRSFEAYRATDTTASVDHIVVSGATGLEAELAQSLAARFAARAELFAPDKILDLSASRAKELRGFSAVLGLALGQERAPLVSFDFLSPKKPISRRTVRMRKVPRVALTAAFLVAAIGVTYYKFVHVPIAAADAMRLEVVALQPDKKRVTGFKELLENVEDWRSSEQYWPEVLATLTQEFPTSDVAQVTRISFDTVKDTKSKGKKYVAQMDMRLRTAELGVVNDITEKLRTLGFEDVIPDSESPIGGRRTSIYRFETGVRARLPKRKHVKVVKEATEEEDTKADAENSAEAKIETPEPVAATPDASTETAPMTGNKSNERSAVEPPVIENETAPANDAVSSAVTTSEEGAES
ncbi:MAG: pilus assembly protein PilM [Phycisphaerales bacterium]|nr:pilus assembly protein PilM [Phycisphaerales bacterium]MCB9855872.1 pilus assembly protein PilM [Phycisphaerales bacterium]